MVLLDGKLIADQIKSEIAREVKTNFLDKGIAAPHLAAVLVGEDPASQTYVASKEKACKEVGFISSVYRYPENISEKQLLEAVSLALHTRPVARCECSSLVKKEQLRVAPRRHDRLLTALEAQQADDPALALVLAPDDA